MQGKAASSAAGIEVMIDSVSVALLVEPSKSPRASEVVNRIRNTTRQKKNLSAGHKLGI